MTAQDDRGVRAPADSVAWTATYGWLLDAADLPRVHRTGDLVLLVDPTRHITGLSGLAPLAALVRVDRDVHELAARLDRVLALLDDVANEGLRR